jgi:Rod binding domain-containing protein
MDVSNAILTESIGRPEILPEVKNVDKASEQEKERLAKEFESLIVGRLLDEMNNTVNCLGLDEDGASKQVKGIFNFCLSQHIGANGGFGLWKEIYESLKQMNQIDGPKELDKQI